jgi:hypothetical protein
MYFLRSHGDSERFGKEKIGVARPILGADNNPVI